MRRSYTWERGEAGRWERRRIINGGEKETKDNRRWTSEPMSVRTREMIHEPMDLRHLFCLTMSSRSHTRFQAMVIPAGEAHFHSSGVNIPILADYP
jgi:hypothetical protein